MEIIMELIKEKKSCLEILFSGSEKIPVNGDIIVPDTKPDVLKVLQTNADCSISDKGLTAQSMYAEGMLNVNILYLPEDTSGICCINSSFVFNSKIPLANVDSSMKLKLSCNVSRIEFVLLNSRKLAIKASVTLNYDVIGERELEFPVGCEELTAEIASRELCINSIAAYEECDFIVRDSLEVPSGKASISEILKTDAQIYDIETKAVTGKLIVKGILSVCTLYRCTNGKTDFCSGEFPFTEVFDVYELEDEDDCLLNLVIHDISLDTSPDNDNDLRIVNMECIISASLRVDRHHTISLLSDCYCPGLSTAAEYNELSLNRYCETLHQKTTLKEIASTNGNLPEISKIYNVLSEADISKCEAKNGKITIEGNIKAYILYLTEDEKYSVCSFKKDIPFSYTSNTDNTVPACQCDIGITTLRTSYSINSSGEIELRCILSFDVILTEKIRLTVISTVDTHPTDECGDIIVYFVKNGDTLWSVAKNYSVKQSDILEINALDSDTLSPGQKLLIPA